MDKKNFISVVMPVYNTCAEYLNDSISSVLEQSYELFELIIVDDFSNDRETLVILDEFASRENRVKLIHLNEHSGAATARNIGIIESRSDYIIFLDSDDYFDKDLLKICVSTAKKNDADIVVFNYRHYQSDMLKQDDWYGRSENFYIKYASFPYRVRGEAYKDILFGSYATGTKFFSREFILEHGLQFQNQPRQNDVFFSIASLLLAKKVIHVKNDKILLHARDHAGEYRISNAKHPECAYNASLKLISKMIEENCIEETLDLLSESVCSLVLQSLRQCEGEQGMQFYQFLCNKGIDQYKILLGKYFDKASYSIKGLEGAFEETYDSYWWTDNNFDWVLWLNSQVKLVNRLKEMSFTGKRIGIWGMGKRGLIVFRWLLRNGLKCVALFDSDTDKQGMIVNDIKISSPLDVKERCEVLLTANKRIYSMILCEYIEIIDDFYLLA